MWQISKESASRIEDWVGEWPVVRAGFFRLAGTVNLRQCVGLGGYFSGRNWKAISRREVTGKPGLTEEGGA